MVEEEAGPSTLPRPDLRSWHAADCSLMYYKLEFAEGCRRCAGEMHSGLLPERLRVSCTLLLATAFCFPE